MAESDAPIGELIGLSLQQAVQRRPSGLAVAAIGDEAGSITSGAPAIALSSAFKTGVAADAMSGRICATQFERSPGSVAFGAGFADDDAEISP